MMWGGARPNAGERPGCASSRKSFAGKQNATGLAEVYRRALNARSNFAPVNLVEAAGIEPASQGPSPEASTHIVSLFVSRRPGSD